MPSAGQEGESKGQIPPPKCKAILLCRYAMFEAGTGMPSIIGVISNLTVLQCPVKIPLMYAFIQLVDGIGRYEIVLEFQNVSDGQVIGRGVGPGVIFPDRPLRMNLLIPIPPVPIPRPGDYDLVVFANGQEIDRQKFTVSVPDGGQENATPTL